MSTSTTVSAPPGFRLVEVMLGDDRLIIEYKPVVAWRIADQSKEGAHDGSWAICLSSTGQMEQHYVTAANNGGITHVPPPGPDGVWRVYKRVLGPQSGDLEPGEVIEILAPLLQHGAAMDAATMMSVSGAELLKRHAGKPEIVLPVRRGQ
jgi:hypothetical protein